MTVEIPSVDAFESSEEWEAAVAEELEMDRSGIRDLIREIIDHYPEDDGSRKRDDGGSYPTF